MVDNKAKSKDLNQIFDDFVKERLGKIDFNAKNKDLCPIFEDFCPRK